MDEKRRIRHQTGSNYGVVRWLCEERVGSAAIGHHLPALFAAGSSQRPHPHIALYATQNTTPSNSYEDPRARTTQSIELRSSTPHDGHVTAMQWCAKREREALLVTGSKQGSYSIFQVQSTAAHDEARLSMVGDVKEKERVGGVPLSHAPACSIKNTRVIRGLHTRASANALDVLGDGTLMCGGGSDGVIVNFDVSHEHVRGRPIAAHSQTIQSVRLLGRDTVASAAASIKLWDFREKTDRPQSVLKDAHRRGALICSTAIHPDRPHLMASASSDGTLLVWDLRGHQYPIFRGQKHTSSIWEVEFIPSDQDQIVTCGQDGRVLVWETSGGWRGSSTRSDDVSMSLKTKSNDVVDGCRTYELLQAPLGVTSLHYHPQRACIVSSSEGGSIFTSVLSR